MPPAFFLHLKWHYWCIYSSFSLPQTLISFLNLNLHLHLHLHTRSTMSPLNVEEEGDGGKRRPNFPGDKCFKRSSVDPVGLRILTQFSHGESNLVLKSACRLRVPTRPPPSGASPETCFLKSCYLCNKELTPDKDIYMRGDEGFCSVECRSRQIVMDETKEIEASTKKMLASFRHCRTTGGCETCVLLEDLRGRKKSISGHKNQALVS